MESFKLPVCDPANRYGWKKPNFTAECRRLLDFELLNRQFLTNGFDEALLLNSFPSWSKPHMCVLGNRRRWPLMVAINIILSCLVNSLSAGLVVTSTPGSLHEADGYTSFTTGSAEMVGLLVTVNFRNGTTESANWGVNGIATSNFSITQGPGSSFSVPFEVDNLLRSRIMSIEFHGGGTTTLFDRSVTPSTDGTANGKDFQEVSNFSQSQDITVSYFDEIRTVGATPVGDIFAGMRIEFSFGLRRRDPLFQFITDTDTSTGLIRPVSTFAVPEVSTGLSFGFAFAVSCFRRRRRN